MKMRRNFGFTLVELVVVITIMGILGFVGIRGFGNTVTAIQEREDRDMLMSTIRSAQARARTSGCDTLMVYDSRAQTLTARTTEGGTPSACNRTFTASPAQGWVDLEDPSTGDTLMWEGALTITNNGGATLTSWVFGPLGHPRQANTGREISSLISILHTAGFEIAIEPTTGHIAWQ